MSTVVIRVGKNKIDSVSSNRMKVLSFFISTVKGPSSVTEFLHDAVADK